MRTGAGVEPFFLPSLADNVPRIHYPICYSVNSVELSLHIASVVYTLSTPFLEELNSCATDFKERLLFYYSEPSYKYCIDYCKFFSYMYRVNGVQLLSCAM
jgi:hypothetical protein